MMDSLVASTFRLGVHDIANGDGIATVTLRSGVQLSGTVKLNLTDDVVLHLKTARGWHTIDWNDIAALSGEAR